MNEGLISSRYATALLNFATQNDEEKKVYSEMTFLVQIFKIVKNLQQSLSSPVVSKSKKKKILITAVGGNVSNSMDKFFDLLIENKRENKLESIASRYTELYRKRHNIHLGTLTTAVKTDPSVIERLKVVIEEQIGGTVEFTSDVNPDIIGGFVLQVEDYRWDASISGQLNRIKKELKQINKI